MSTSHAMLKPNRSGVKIPSEPESLPVLPARKKK